MTRAPLDDWLRSCLDLWSVDARALRQWQMAELRRTLAHAQASGPLYRSLLGPYDPAALRSLGDLGRLPRITADDLRRHPEALLCVSQDEVARAVTLQSSGTTGPGKRIFFSAGDLERTIDFFHHGMRLMMEPEQTALVLLPGDRPDSVGKLLAEAVKRLGGRGLVKGPLDDPEATLDIIRSERVSCLVGSPAHLNVLAALWRSQGLGPGDSPVRAALLCWDAVPDAVVRNLAAAFGCRSHRHWGMVETGLGGAVECTPGSGLHLREADLLVEIADPDSGRSLPAGEWGEITVTTLRRRAMPLVRYRTGDLGRIRPGACPCGSPLRLLDPDIRRLGGAHQEVDLTLLNETLYSLTGLADFTASVEPGELPGESVLHIRVCSPNRDPGLPDRAVQAVRELKNVRQALAAHSLNVQAKLLDGPGPAEPGLAKRYLKVNE